VTFTILAARTCQTCQHYVFSQDANMCGKCLYPVPAWITNSATPFVSGWEGANCPLHTDIAPAASGEE